MLERPDVAPDGGRHDADLLVAAAHQYPGSQSLPKEVERLAKGAARLRVARLRPEEGEERIAPVKSWRIGQRQIGEERQPLRLDEQRAQLSTPRPLQVEWTQGVELNGRGDGGGDRRGRWGEAVIRQVTLPKR
ncbi:MAG: hypothetical protein ACJ8AO_05905 [Gemmatimonadaceae bacterium]